MGEPVFDDDGDGYDDDCDGPICMRCSGTGFFVSCIDDMCHGQEQCIHGGSDICPSCGGSGNAPSPSEKPISPPEHKASK